MLIENFRLEVKMKTAKFGLMTMAVVLCASQAYAQSALQTEIDQLREDVQILQRQAYRNKQDELNPASAQSVAVQIGQFDENLRQAIGNERHDVMNKDIDMRFRMYEGKPLESGGMNNADTAVKKFEAPVAKGAPASIVGGAVAKGDDLAPVKTQSAEDIYKQGMTAINAGNNDEAAQKFTALMTKYPEHKLAGNAQYWLGEAYYAKKDYAKAAVAFGKGLEKYKDGNKGADSLLKLGMSMRELGKKEEACTAFKTLPTEFPKAEETTKTKAAGFAKALECK